MSTHFFAGTDNGSTVIGKSDAFYDGTTNATKFPSGVGVGADVSSDQRMIVAAKDSNPGGAATYNLAMKIEFESKASARSNAGRALNVISTIGPRVLSADTGHYGIVGEILSYGPQVEGSHVALNLANRKKNKASGFAIDATTDDENSWGAATDVTSIACMKANVGGQGMDHPSNANGLGRRNIVHLSARPMDASHGADVTGITQDGTAGVVAVSSRHRFVVGDNVFVENVAGMTQVNAGFNGNFAGHAVGGLLASVPCSGTMPPFAVGDRGLLRGMTGAIGTLLNDVYYYCGAVDAANKTIRIMRLGNDALEEINSSQYPACSANGGIFEGWDKFTIGPTNGFSPYVSGGAVWHAFEAGAAVPAGGGATGMAGVGYKFSSTPILASSSAMALL